MKMETLIKKIAKQQEKTDALKVKYDEIGKKYSDASKELKRLLDLKAREEEREKYSALEKACADKNVDIQIIADAIKNGKMDMVLNAMAQADNRGSEVANNASGMTA